MKCRLSILTQLLLFLVYVSLYRITLPIDQGQNDVFAFLAVGHYVLNRLVRDQDWSELDRVGRESFSITH